MAERPPQIIFTVKEMLVKMDEKIDLIHEQTVKHNGRMNRIETNPMVRLGEWIIQNPLRTLLFAIAISLIANMWFVSDFREPTLHFLLQLIL